MLERGYRFDVKELFEEAQRLYGDRKWKLAPTEAIAKLNDFFIARVKNYFLTQGKETLLVEADRRRSRQRMGPRPTSRRIGIHESAG